MSQRFVSWSAALRDIRADRIQLAPSERVARSRQQAFQKVAFLRAQATACVRPFVVAKAYDRRAIMCSSVAAAKARRAVTGDAWRLCLSAALKGTWLAAKATRLLSGWREKGGVAQAGATSASVRPLLPQGPASMQSTSRSTEVPSAHSLLTRLQGSPRPWTARAHQSDNTAPSPRSSA